MERKSCWAQDRDSLERKKRKTVIKNRTLLVSTPLFGIIL